ncbi:VanZ family protein [Paenibacillus sp. UNC499MF]|uniref:VanZ family protein n=1 Tax=Paenibacillus sp. UNC499MF TaxID=1502751 RepID=UPI0008A0229D|nr:VanZ family protein [Paenibacillus sp. UNC499MF]SEF83851.1 Glycopeptide antibiotics resistance protein [Paenibacillus sp. UNC499MF]
MLWDFDGSTVLLALLVLIVLLVRLKIKHKRSHLYLLLYVIFYIYMVNVLRYTLFPIPLFVWEHDVFRLSYDLDPTNFVHWEAAQIYNNILLSVPFGFGLPFLRKVSFKRMLRAGVMFGVAIEGAQLLLSLLFRAGYRSVDVNDVLLNFTGVLLGYGCYRLFAALVRRISPGKKRGLSSLLDTAV